MDYNNDGFLDIYITGKTDTSSYSYLYNNDKNGSFIIQSEIELSGMQEGSSVWGDYDLDSDLDLLSFSVKSGIYPNNTTIKNTPPFVPEDLSAYIDNGRLYLSWDKSTDTETPQLGLTYNLRIGTTPGGSEIMSSHALADGTRTIVSRGNVQQNTSWWVQLPTPLPENIYYSVQAIDNGYLASEWSPEQSNVSKFVADFSPTSGCQKNEIDFEDKSYSIDYPITAWLWEFNDGGNITESTLQNPSYTFQNPGSQTVELTVTNSNNETETRSKTVNVKPSPLTGFAAPNVCEGTQTAFTNLTDANTCTGINYTWAFNDGTDETFEGENAPDRLFSPGTYNVNLIAMADNGCSLVTTKEVVVAEIPSKQISVLGATEYCGNDNTMIYVDNQVHYSYQWLAAGATVTDSTNYNLYPKYTSTYTATINNTLAPNCSVESSPISLTVKPAPEQLIITAPEAGNYCVGDESSKITAPLVAGHTYNWLKDGNTTESGSEQTEFIPTSTGSYTYSLRLTNAEGCSSISQNEVSGITILPIPGKPNVSNPTPEFCAGTAFTITTPLVADYTYQWLENKVLLQI